MTALLRPWMPWIALALFALAIIVAVPPTCRKIRAIEAQSRVERGLAEAAAASGDDAVETIGAAGRRERDSDQLSQSNDKEIRDAEGASNPVGDGVNRAGLDGLCRRSAYRDSERCRLRGAAS